MIVLTPLSFSRRIRRVVRLASAGTSAPVVLFRRSRRRRKPMRKLRPVGRGRRFLALALARRKAGPMKALRRR